jgi:hypothetical protein
VRSALHVCVPPLSRTVLAREEAASVHAAEVSVDECVPAFGLVGRSVGQAEVPLGVLAPGVAFEESVLVFSRRLRASPIAAQDVLTPFDQSPSLRDRAVVDGVGGDS